MTKTALEKQNNDLRIRLENRNAKAELNLFEAEETIKELKSQLRDKDKVITMLQKEIVALNEALEKAADLQSEEIQQMIRDAMAPILQRLEEAYDEINRLKAIIDKDSSNSSKPPRTNNFKEIPNNREPSERKRGGQKGHPGHRLKLPDNLDELVEQGKVVKELKDHTNGSSEYITRYVIDVRVVTTVTEHRFALDAEIPKGMYNEVSYGDQIEALAVYLLTEGIIAEDRLSDMICGITHGVITISPATIEKYLSDFAKGLVTNGELDAIKEHLLNGKVMNTDDTPVGCTETIEYHDDGTTSILTAKKKSFTATIRNYSNSLSTLFTVNPQKNIEGIIRDNILPIYFGILGHDHESKFYRYGIAHATCGSHLTRDLKGLNDLLKIPWADIMRSFILSVNTHKQKDLAAGITMCNPIILASFESKYDDIVKQGRAELALLDKDAWNYSEFNNMVNRLIKYKDCYLFFIRDYDVPFTNNLSERDLRSEKTRAKVSGPYRSWKGINNHVKIRSFISTLKKREMDLYAAIVDVIQGTSVLNKPA